MSTPRKAHQHSSSNRSSEKAGSKAVSKQTYELSKKSLNVSAGMKLYERASSRHERHRAVLQRDVSVEEAVPLGQKRCHPKKRKGFEDDIDEQFEDHGKQRFHRVARALQPKAHHRTAHMTSAKKPPASGAAKRIQKARIGGTSVRHLVSKKMAAAPASAVSSKKPKIELGGKGRKKT